MTELLRIPIPLSAEVQDDDKVMGQGDPQGRQVPARARAINAVLSAHLPLFYHPSPHMHTAHALVQVPAAPLQLGSFTRLQESAEHTRYTVTRPTCSAVHH